MLLPFPITADSFFALLVLSLFWLEAVVMGCAYLLFMGENFFFFYFISDRKGACNDEIQKRALILF